ncbi:acyl-CoA dehydrogenase family protein [Nannocystaceae bacterium ST9]
MSFASHRILDRDLATIAPPHEPWRRLEDRLEAFCAELERHAIDEGDVGLATRVYVQKLAEAGLLRLVVPGEWGGEHERVSATAICLARQWLARVSGALDTAFVMQGLGSFPIALAGQAALQRRILPAVARGELICAFALTEPEAGSDVSGIQTIAEPLSDGGVLLHGDKTFISNAGIADSYVVFAREAERTPEGKPRFGAFWVPADAEGLRVTPITVTAPHPIGSVHLRSVSVPAEHRIGEPGQGLKIALANLDQFRATVGAAALGIADRAFTASVEHLGARVQFGKPLATQQGLRFALAELAAEHVAAQLMVYRAAAARDRGEAGPDQPAMAKLLATELAQRVVDRCVQNFGGRGVVVGEVPERLYREVRALRIYEGTSEIQKLIIARALLG